MSKDILDLADGDTIATASLCRIPAWKRLGLKLKFAKDVPLEGKEKSEIGPSPEKRRSSSSDKAHPETSTIPDQPAHKKRRIHDSVPDTESANIEIGHSLSESKRAGDKRKKRVSFSAETKKEDGDTAISISPSEFPNQHTSQSTDRHPKKTKIPKKAKAQQRTEHKVHSALQYLDTHHKSNDTWKFNKNKETWLLKHLFSVDDIPAEFDNALSSYLLGLKGESAKQRLIQRANDEFAAACLEVVSARNSQSEVTNTKRHMDDPEERKRLREDAARRHKRDYEAYLTALEDAEAQQDPELQKRLEKRRRAEIVLWAVDVDKATGKVENTKQSESPAASTTSKSVAPTLNGVKKKRKNRTAMVELSESSSSDSDSDSDSDSSGDSDSETQESTGRPSEATTKSSVSADDSSSDSSSESPSISSSDDESTESEPSRDTNGVSSTTLGPGSSVSSPAARNVSSPSSNSDESDTSFSAPTNNDSESSSEDDSESDSS